MGNTKVTKAMAKQIGRWEQLVQRQNKDGDGKFILNPDRSRVELLAKGVLANEKNHGFKYCPCRMTTGNREEDLLLVCPCNFFAQKTWQEKGECWCSLFVKK